MIFGFTLLEVLWYYLIYSFCGWCVEVIYCTVTSGKVVNRGFLNGPVCPVYGAGMLMILFLLRIIGYDDISQASFPVLFIGGMILASLVEFIAGWALMKLFHARWWDYSMRPFNIGGYICLQFSICWGFGCYFAVRAAHTPISHFVESPVSTRPLFLVILGILYVIFAVDFGLTLMTVIGLNKKLKEIDEMSARMRVVSDELSERIGTQALKTDQKIGETRLQAALARAELRDARKEATKKAEKNLSNLKRDLQLMKDDPEKIEELREQFQKQLDEKWKQLLQKPGIATNRLMKAFPTLEHKRYQEIMDEFRRRR